MSDKRDSYRSIMKATSLFGGVQIFQILISLIKSKFVAILLGPKGMGIVEMLRSTLEVMTAFTNMRIGTSSVKNIAAASSKGDQQVLSTVVFTLERLLWFTGLLGLILTFLLAPWLSSLTFGNDDFTFAFRYLSITLLTGQLLSGQMAILQGLRKLKFLAKANIIGSTAGLFVTIPMYYLWGIDGIVPVLIGSSVISLLVSFYFRSKIKLQKIKMSQEVALLEGKNMMKMGVMIGLGGLLSIIASYGIRVFISKTGSLEDVGLFSAGFVIIGIYVGMVFDAMGKDYYPRLSTVIDDKINTNEIVNQQSEIAILILAPMISLFIIFIKWGIIIVYTSKFLAITNMVQWASLGILFKAVAWAMGFIYLAKGDSKWVFWNSLIYRIYFFTLNILGYYYYGLTGLGISFFLSFVLGALQNLIITNILYEFTFQTQFIKVFTFQFTIVILCFSVMQLNINPLYYYILGTLLFLGSLLYSLNELGKRLELKTIIKMYTNKWLNK